MIDTRFWLASRAQLQVLQEAGIHQHELVSVSFGVYSRARCQVDALAFIRLGKQFGVTQVSFSQFGRDQPRFVHQSSGIEFVCVCSDAQRDQIAEAFEMLCVDGHLQEAGF